MTVSVDNSWNSRLVKTMQHALLWFSLVLFMDGIVLGIAQPATSAEQAQGPHVVLIMADDLGFSDLGCYGSEIETPHLDRLARGGLRFNQFYNTAKCHSSRICLLTGLYMFQAGDRAMDKAVTIAEALEPAGYQRLMVGKWHLKGQPTERGFQRYFGHLSGATNYFLGDDSFRLDKQPFSVPQDGSFYTTDAITDYGLQFLEQARQTDKPFFLYMAYNAPHYPLQVKKDDYQKYINRYQIGWDHIRQQRYAKQQRLGILPPTVQLSPRPERVPAWKSLSPEQQQWEASRMAAYAGMVDCLDHNIGRVVEYLKKHQLFDNTLILFCSDNGACPFERTRGQEHRPWDPRSYWTYDDGWAHVGNTPLRHYKQNQHEGGISSPLIVSWPQGLSVPAEMVTDQSAHLIDLLPTILEVCRTPYPQDYQGRAVSPLQGKSLLPIFRGKLRQAHPWLYFQYSTNRAIRQGDLKLVSQRGRPWELYDLRTDRAEMHDLISQQPEVAEKLERLWHKVAREIEQAPQRLRQPIGKKNSRQSSTEKRRKSPNSNRQKSESTDPQLSVRPPEVEDNLGPSGTVERVPDPQLPKHP